MSELAYDLALFALIGLVAICLQPLVFASQVPVALKLEIALVFGVTMLRPAAGLLIMAALVPFSATAALLWRAESVRWADAVVFAFLASWLLERWVSVRSRERLRKELLTPALLFGAVIIASCMVQVWQLDPQSALAPARTVWRVLSADLFFVGRRTAGLPEGFALLQGLTLFVATAAICRTETRPGWRAGAVMVAAAVAAAGLSILLSQHIAPQEVLRRAENLSMVRVAAHIADVNAAGSYFAMMACLALGMAAAIGQPWRGVYVGGSGLIAAGLWLSGSRVALAAGLVMLGLLVAQLRAARERRGAGGAPKAAPALGCPGGAPKAAPALGCPEGSRGATEPGWGAEPHVRWPARLVTMRTVLLALGLGLLGLVAARRAASLGPLTLRVQFFETALRMMASAPLFGVGVGQFYPLSRRFMSPQLGWNYSLENAHNYFLQIAAELGIVGVAALLYLLGAAWTRSRGDLSRKSELWGLVAGLGAFVATWLAGHPLLVREVAYPFWMTLALVWVWAKPSAKPATVDSGRGVPGHRFIPIVAIGILLASVPFRTDPPTRRTLVYGVHDEEQQPDGRLARWTEKFATVVVRVEAGSVEMSMRAPRATSVDVAVDGQQVETLQLTESWRRVPIALPPPAPDALYRRIDLRIDRTWPLSEIAPGSTDTRVVGIQLGDVILSAAR